MRNRAKCKLCGDIIESFTIHDYVECKCGEIGIDGGLHYLKASAKDFKNFFRVDDNGTEIQVKYEEEKEEYLPQGKPTKNEMIEMLEEMAKSIERLPQHAMTAPITHADHCALILLLVEIMKSQD